MAKHDDLADLPVGYGGHEDHWIRLVEEGPPFDIQVLGLERHHVFVSEREVLFFFEGDSAAAAVDALSRSRRVLNVAVRWRGIVGGRPRLAEERFRWTRTI